MKSKTDDLSDLVDTLGRVYNDAVPDLPRNVCPEIVGLLLHVSCLRAQRKMHRTHIYDGNERSEVRSEAIETEQ